MNEHSFPSVTVVIGAAARREILSHRLNRFLYAHFLLVLLAGLLPLLTPDDALVRGAAWWLLHAVLYTVSLSALLLGLVSAHAEKEEFTWLLGQPSGMGPWLMGKIAALTGLVTAASALLALPSIFAGGASRDLLIASVGAAGVSAVGAAAGLALGFWIRDPVRGLVAAVAIWFGVLFGTDLLLLASAGVPAVRDHPDLWVAALMTNPLDAYRITVLFTVERAAFSGIEAGRLAGWWVAHAIPWFASLCVFWFFTAAGVAWLGCRRRLDN